MAMSKINQASQSLSALLHSEFDAGIFRTLCERRHITDILKASAENLEGLVNEYSAAIGKPIFIGTFYLSLIRDD